MAKLYSFDDHPEHKARLGEWRDRWVAVALHAAPQTDEDRDACRAAMRCVYAAVKLAPVPEHRGVFCAGPMSGAIAAVIASCVWWLREHPEQHAALFGRALNEADLLAAIPAAAHRAVCAAMGAPMPPLPEITRDATRDATDAAARAATRAATRDATDAATYAATDAATYAATDAATYAATRAATDAATSDATRDATFAATRDATDAATDAATRAATYAATDAATDAATRAATYDATYAATRDATDAATDTTGVVAFCLAAMPGWERMHVGGNQWAGWCAYLSFFDRVAGLDLPQYAAWRHYESMALHGGPRFEHARFWIVCDFPIVVRQDDAHRPHCASGPQLAWRDGFATWYWRGTAVPREWIEHPESIDPQLALTHENSEMRRVVAEIVGWDKVLDRLDPMTINEDKDPTIGTLLEVTIEGERERFLRVLCGTGRTFALPVPPTMKSALAAQAWLWGDDANPITAREMRRYEART